MALAPAAEAQASRVAVYASVFEWPFVPQQDPEKPMCIGVQTTTWGGNGDGQYTGPCRFGAPLGVMRGALRYMDQKRAVGTAKEYGVSESNGSKLQVELDVFGKLGLRRGMARIKRHANNETKAAQDQEDSKKSSWLRRSIVNCAVWGSIAGTADNVLSALLEGKKPGPGTVKSMAAACATAVVAPPVQRWIKSKGYDMEA